jgi:hypothetical protein
MKLLSDLAWDTKIEKQPDYQITIIPKTECIL